MLTLVVMAAGLGSRFGGTKQLAAVGPDGEAFLDFAIRDALDASVSKVVLVVRSDIEDDIRCHIATRHPEVPVAFVCQDHHGPPRARPWGTAHAVLAAAAEVNGTFLVVNADDYYGRSVYQTLCSTASSLPANRALLAGYRLDRTVPELGKVSRGVCSVNATELVALVETHGINRLSDGSIVAADPAGIVAADATVSMNLWMFPHRLFGLLERGFSRFLDDHGHDGEAEYLLATVVAELMGAGELTVGVVPTSESWVGITNPDDLEVARRQIAKTRQPNA